MKRIRRILVGMPSDHCLCRGICCREGISDVSGGAGREESCADPEGNSGR